MNLYSIACRIASEDDVESYIKESSQGDGYKIITDYGYIEYRPVNDEGDFINEIWWVQSNKSGGGTRLVNLMMKENPSHAIAWGVTSQLGKKLMESWHRKNPNILCIKGPLEGQFDPYGQSDDPVDQQD